MTRSLNRKTIGVSFLKATLEQQASNADREQLPLPLELHEAT